MLIIIKIIISISMILGLVYISEKNPKLGGLFSGLPLSVGIFIYFYAQQEGISFVINSTPYSIAGLSSALIFTVGFYLGSKLLTRNRLLNTLCAFVIGLSVFLFSGYVITLFHFNLISSLAIFLIVMIITILFFLKVPKAVVSMPAKNTYFTIAFRATFATCLILGITGITKLVGPKWAGVFASFPVMLGSVSIILIFTYGNKLFPNVLKHFSYSISILALYFILAYWLYPLIGINLGTLAAYTVCFIYLYCLSNIGKRLS
jgi:hypothetical protein